MSFSLFSVLWSFSHFLNTQNIFQSIFSNIISYASYAYGILYQILSINHTQYAIGKSANAWTELSIPNTHHESIIHRVIQREFFIWRFCLDFSWGIYISTKNGIYISFLGSDTSVSFQNISVSFFSAKIRSCFFVSIIFLSSMKSFFQKYFQR